jgi:hypothetical protein
MKIVTYIAGLILLVVLLSLGFGIFLVKMKQPEILGQMLKAKEQMIVSKVKQDTPYFTNFEATYNLAFTNFLGRLWGDSIYVRKDRAKVFYGYSLNDAEIKIIQEQDEPILWVRLPSPKQVATDRKVLLVEANPKDYWPIDSEKHPIDVEQWMNERLDTTLQNYEGKSLEMTRKMSQEYFEAIAHHFNLKLKLEFK